MEHWNFWLENWKKIRFQVWNLENFSSKTPTRRGLFVKKKLLRIFILKVFYKGFPSKFYKGIPYIKLYKGFPYKMNREKIKGNSFGGPFTPTQSSTPPYPHTQISPASKLIITIYILQLTINHVIERKKIRVRERKKNRERERERLER